MNIERIGRYPRNEWRLIPLDIEVAEQMEFISAVLVYDTRDELIAKTLYRITELPIWESLPLFRTWPHDSPQIRLS